jgi:hypothetical protein
MSKLEQLKALRERGQGGVRAEPRAKRQRRVMDLAVKIAAIPARKMKRNKRRK